MTDFFTAYSPAGLGQTIAQLKAKRTDVFDVIFSDKAPRIRVPSGIDRVPFTSYTENSKEAAKRISGISEKVRSGNYRFDPFCELAIPKDNGEDRILSVCSAKDAIVQHIALQQLEACLGHEMSPCCYGYRPGRSANQAVGLIRKLLRQGFVHIFESDLQKFFDTVPQEGMIQKVNQALAAQPVQFRQLIRSFIKARKVPPSNQSKRCCLKPGLTWKTGSLPRTEGLPQGGALSGFLTNLYLTEFDRAFENKRHLRLVRYADDFVILCKTASGRDRARRQTKKLLETLGLKLHPDKTKSFDARHESIDFVGFRLQLQQSGHILRARIRPKTMRKRYQKLAEVIAGARHGNWCPCRLASRLNNKVFGLHKPSLTEEQLTKAAAHLTSGIRGSRSWLQFFLQINSNGQLRQLDSWLRRQFWTYRRQAVLCKRGDCAQARPISYKDFHYKLRRETKKAQRKPMESPVTATCPAKSVANEIP